MTLVCKSAPSGKPKGALALPDLNRRVQGRCPTGVVGNRFMFWSTRPRLTTARRVALALRAQPVADLPAPLSAVLV